MVADIAAKQRDLDLAVDERARRAPLSRACRTAVASFTAAMAARPRRAARDCAVRAGPRRSRARRSTRKPNSRCSRRSTLNPDDMEALYTIGVVRMAVRRRRRRSARVRPCGAEPMARWPPRLATRCACCTRAAPPPPERASTPGDRAHMESARAACAGEPALASRDGMRARRRAASATHRRIRTGSRRAWRKCSEPTGPPT